MTIKATILQPNLMKAHPFSTLVVSDFVFNLDFNFNNDPPKVI